MELTGRVTANAKVTETKNGKKVTNFSIAINDRYKTKEGEAREVVTFVNCAYWLNAGIAPYLKKGTLVELYGRIGVNVWTNADGEAKGAVTFHVSNIKLHGKPNATEKQNVPAAAAVTEPADDLPF
ncbi:MAG TPA: single-stranded DNA-binding protein [Chitinophagaceae bacterium]|nr:single-stranded DNA-binding protein [Chitinophagaceae bacterium]